MRTTLGRCISGGAPGAAIAAMLLASSLANAGGTLPRAIYSDQPDAENSFLPQSRDERFGTETWKSISASPNGEWWTLTCFVGTFTSRNETLIRGSGTDGESGIIIARESEDAFDLAFDRRYQHLDDTAQVNDAGTVFFGGDFIGSQDDDYLATWKNGDYTLIAQEGETCFPFFLFAAKWTILDTPVILENDMVGFTGRNIIGNPGGADQSEAFVLGTSVRIFEGETVPTGQAGGGTRAWEVIDSGNVDYTADGLRYIAKGDLKGGSDADDDIVVVDGAVVVQEGQTLPGFSSPVDDAALTLVRMTPNGDWFIDGGNNDGGDWIMRNGAIIARTGQPITPGNAVAWDDDVFASLYFLMIGNRVGDYVVGGYVDSGDPLRNACLVLNGERVLLWEGDPVDLDGNGLADDGAYIRRWYEQDAFLTDDGHLYFLCSLRASNNDDVAIGQAMVYVDLNGSVSTCPSDIASSAGQQPDGATNVFDLLALLAQWGTAGSADLAGNGSPNPDGVVNVFDLLALLAGWGPCA